MSETAAKLLEQLLALPEVDRLMVAEQLWGSVSEEKVQEIMDEATSDPEYQAELQRRLDSIANGTAVFLEPRQVFAEIREHLRRKRQS
ncbi:MAG: addiction module protein [Planctomycetia bacterium]|nr:addiction module protein [Planctomycetia bacterium]